MSCILNIETSAEVCSVALSQDGSLIYKDEDRGRHNHAEKIGSFVDGAMSFADNHAIPVDAVAVSSGPGSYTGLRIGVSMAKGLCYGRGMKLVSVPTLDLLCVPVLLGGEISEDALLCPMLDAKRMEVYAKLVDRSLAEVRETAADIVDEDTYLEWLKQGPVWFFGPGAGKCKEAINHPNAVFVDGIGPLAENMFPLAEQRLARGIVEDVAYFVPQYLKDFDAKLPKPLI